ncbi:UvrD-helicase domain-containing protein [Gayadomonas joobiniege]|uniref:UvrD-helicase domain-containing protein n=1 Tax=Gayadomonas joobiniege TaxID=1234606 RepID=UPI000363C644|nr:UvrD-helicase domain-containing protein [Gayadomonas joobiniege]
MQQLLATRSALTLTSDAILIDKNNQVREIPLDQINKIHVTKGWWFSRLHINSLERQTYVCKGYLYTDLLAFHQQTIQHLIASVADNDRWQWFYQQMLGHKSAQYYYSSYEWQNIQQLKTLAAEFNKLGVTEHDFKLLMHREIFLYANQLTKASVSEAGRAQHNQRVVQNLLQRDAPFFAKLNQHPLTPAQQLACVNNNDHTLVVAGAGSGKTALIMAKTAYLVARKLAEPEHILLLAFGQKAADEMRSRLDQKLPLIAERIQVKTFHSFGLSLLKQKYGQQYKQTKESIEPRLLAVHQDLLQTSGAYQNAFQAVCKHYQLSEEKLMKQVVNCWPIIQENGLRGHCISAVQTWLDYLVKAEAADKATSFEFSDMIKQSAELLANGQVSHTFKYIIVDEFQDISAGRIRLLQALLSSSANCRLFAVGDDWQSIYRFNGAEVSFFTEFDKHFAPSERLTLDQTFRFNDKIEAVSSRFIRQNPNQINKQVNPQQKINEAAVHLFPVQDYMAEVKQILSHINQQAGQLGRSISLLLISRNALSKTPGLESLYVNKGDYKHLQITVVTAHASKGLEADISLILGVEQGMFPSTYGQQALQNAVLAAPEAFNHAEERRLFYVALTRAKHQVYLLYKAGRGSEFIDELKSYPSDWINH